MLAITKSCCSSFVAAIPKERSCPLVSIPAHGTSGQAHLGLGVPSTSLPAWTERLEQMGIFIESSLTWPDGGTSIYFRDPDGHLLELLTRGVWPNY